MPRRMSKEEFIEKACKVHGGKYDYSKVEYVNSSTKVCIICPKHGEFWQKPNSHLLGVGCPKCKGEKLSTLKSKTTEQFIKEAKLVHGDKYDYSKVVYKKANTKVCIICSKHGEFYQTPIMHLSGQGCFRCSIENNAEKHKLTKEEFINKTKKVHGDKYDYSRTEYVNNHAKICIRCPKHGEFWQQPYSHLQGHGCPLCAAEERKQNQKISLLEFIKRAKCVHGDKYDYSKVKYNSMKGKVEIVCNKHGSFFQSAQDHLNGHGCPKCNCLYKTTEQFIEEAKKIHNNFYSYEKTKYINKLSKVIITCPIHGDFEQIAANHLSGCKCPRCSFSKLEKNLEKILLKNNIEYEYQKKFEWLGRQRLDFFIPKYNTAIECQGIQHFIPKEHLGGKTAFDDSIKRDKIKKQLCEENGVNLLYYTNLNDYSEFLNKPLMKTEQEVIDKIIVSEKEK